ncbi:hypothetical protein FGADI_2080 [Fusarium gaditjirri]|uniref:Fungal N-terminal domain-containing protein n=1 Tax=Fusarium gaditjirri TaxID=282569 RepID=A0A8H4X1P8_9HYPO|nr:hypothetical protein FGADI_2080 [Fusarium gaditjirri]
MDGLSVAASCIAVIQAADQTYRIISQFVRDCSDARSDLTAVSQELSTLTRTLAQLKDLVPDDSDSAGSDLTNNTKRDIRDIVASCLVVAGEIKDVLSGHEGRLAALSWATRGKRKVLTSKVLLQTNRRALSLAVDTITLATAQNIRQDTTNILDDTTHIRGDIHELMARIRNLEVMVADKDPNDPRTYVLMRYLNDLSSVAGSVFDMSSRPATPESNASEYMLIDVISGEVIDVDPKPPRFSLTNFTFIIETLKVEILTTDASLFLASVKTAAGRYWMLGDRNTSEWTRQMGSPDPVTPCCILSLSQHSALFIQQAGSDGASVLKVIKVSSPGGKSKLVCKGVFLPQSNEVDKGLFTFSRMDHTVTAIQHTQRSAVLYTWRLHEDWFTDTDLTRQVQKPSKLLLPAYDGKEEIAILGLVPGSSVRVLALKFLSDTKSEDIQITGRVLSSDNSHPQQPYKPAQERTAYSYSRTSLMGEAKLSEDRKVIQVKSEVDYGVFLWKVGSPHSIPLSAEKPDDRIILSPNFDHWVAMRKDKRSRDKEPRIYLQTFYLRWPEK